MNTYVTFLLEKIISLELLGSITLGSCYHNIDQKMSLCRNY